MFILGAVVVVVVVLTADALGDPARTGGSFPPHRTARLAPAVIEGREKKQEGSVQLSTPPMQQNEGVYISPPLAASTNHDAFYSFIITGLKGGRKEIRRSTSFTDRVSFPGCADCLRDLKCVYLPWMQCAPFWGGL